MNKVLIAGKRFSSLSSAGSLDPIPSAAYRHHVLQEDDLFFSLIFHQECLYLPFGIRDGSCFILITSITAGLRESLQEYQGRLWLGR